MFSRLITYQKAKQQQQEKPEKHKKISDKYMRKKIGLPNFKRRSRTSCDENEEDDEIKICADYFSINSHSSEQVWAETVKLTGQLNRLSVEFEKIHRRHLC